MSNPPIRDIVQPMPAASTKAFAAAPVVDRFEPAPMAEPAAAAAGRRPSLDGVRALAVGAVMIYHFGGGSASWLPGGFLGVDVFFVLSGYLITGLLLAEYRRTGRIDLPGFWVRRARRLVPALIPLLLTVCAWIWWANPLESYPDRRSDVFWTVGYLANWHLVSGQDNYFAAYATASPLRHTWSLAIEEQFYLLWPLLTALLLGLGYRLANRSLAKRSRRLNPVYPLGLAALLGIAVSAWLMAHDYDPALPATAYYGTQDRVHELFIGVLLAVAFSGALSGSRRTASVLGRYSGPAGVLALAGLGFAFVRMSDTGPLYYRGGAVAVCVLVVVLIAILERRPRGLVARAFAWRPAVLLGRISYGVYLWHWPIVLILPVTAEQGRGEQISRQLARVGLTLALAALSFRFLEQPVQRDRRWLTSRPRVLGAVIASSALVLAVALPATATPGTMVDQLKVISDRSCPGESIDHLISCIAPEAADPESAEPELALLGDSTARALGPGLDDWARDTGSTWLQAAWKKCTATGLPALPQQGIEPDPEARTCHEQAPSQVRAALSRYRPDVVLIVESWTSNHSVLVDGENAAPGTDVHDTAVRIAFERLVDEIAGYGGRAVFLELPPIGDTVGAQFAPGRPAGDHRPETFDRRLVDRFNAVLRKVVAARPDRAELISVTDVVCPDGLCPAMIDGTMVRRDGVHYTRPFSHRLGPVLLDRLDLDRRS
jgi:peptidoglycan/LPS O-acetylase OafA/YrhL